MTNTTLLVRTVGSTAYGLAREGSDIDRIGVFVAPMTEIAGLNWFPQKESKVTKDDLGDLTMHEVGKYIRLALKCNPTVSEVLYVPESEFDITSPEGEAIIEHRQEFLSRTYVFNAYFGYARAQFDKFQTLDFKKKHARHALRIIRQGSQLFTTGELNPVIDDPQEYFDFDDMSNGAILDKLAGEFAKFESIEHGYSPLPLDPNYEIASELLTEIRLNFIQ